MRKCSRSLIVFILFFLSPFFTNTSAHAAVVINELLPKTEPAAQEWVELYNTGSEPVSLDRWHLDHTAGDVKSYILNAGAVIGPHGFLTFSGSQTVISFGIEGDTVRLFDVNGALVDSQSYLGTLGYNTSVGRSTDGGDGWVICTPDPYTATPDKPNNCPPAPTPIPTAGATPFPTATPTPSPWPTKIPPPIQTPTPIRQTFGSLVLGAYDVPSLTPTPDQTSFTVKMDKILAYQILTIAVAWGVIVGIAYVRRKRSIK
jgi:hypothetical protein